MANQLEPEELSVACESHDAISERLDVLFEDISIDPDENLSDTAIR